ncbi:GAF domain-containing protein [Rhizobium sp. BK312]|nr:GAF domain-containing protein [Rhizobium sp. BK312]
MTDIARDPRWAKFKDLALQLGFKACWSTPIFSGDRVVATFAFYFHEQRGPSHLEQQIVDASVHLCAIAIERDERVRERQRLTYMDVLTGLPNRGQFNQGQIANLFLLHRKHLTAADHRKLRFYAIATWRQITMSINA